MAATALRSEERTGLALALAAHAALVAWLVLSPPAPAPLPPPERMSVTLSEDVGLTSTAPQPAAAPAPDEAPVPGEAPPPLPEPVAAPKPPPVPAVRPVLKPAPVPPKPTPAKAVPSRPAPAKPAPPAPAKAAGGSRIGNDFLKGVTGAQGQTRSTNPPAAAIGPAARTALSAAILRQIKPNWQGRVPQGVDADKLVSIVAIELKPDGSLAGPPRLVAQEGINDANRAQAQRHAEAAIRAVQLSAPFILPIQLYDAWKKPPALRMRKSI